MTKNDCFYLAYGSNMYSPRLIQRVPSAKSIGMIAVDGFQLVTNKISKDGSSKCNLVQVPNQRSWCVLFSMSREHIPLLDRAEGKGYGYERKEIALSFQEQPCVAFWYLGQPEYCREEVLPFGWYMDFVRAGAQEHQLPLDYQRILKEWPVVVDPDEKRVRLNQQILGFVR